MRVYLDSNVFISAFNIELGSGVRGLFIEAEGFFELARRKGSVLVLSELFFREVEKISKTKRGEVLEFFAQKGLKVELAFAKGDISLKTLLKQGMHSSDAVHAAVAIKSRCGCIVTFNARHFQAVKGSIKVFEPLEFT